jgi:hypothetical protein
MNPNDYKAPIMPDEDKPCYLCEHCGGNPDFPDDDWCNLLEIGINDWGTCNHYKERYIDSIDSGALAHKDEV